jgi:hypothetical protein
MDPFWFYKQVLLNSVNLSYIMEVIILMFCIGLNNFVILPKPLYSFKRTRNK